MAALIGTLYNYIRCNIAANSLNEKLAHSQSRLKKKNFLALCATGDMHSVRLLSSLFINSMVLVG